jgi:hypothetical protein
MSKREVIVRTPSIKVYRGEWMEDVLAKHHSNGLNHYASSFRDRATHSLPLGQALLGGRDQERSS